MVSRLQFASDLGVQHSFCFAMKDINGLYILLSVHTTVSPRNLDQYCKLLYKMGQNFLDMQYVAGFGPFRYLFRIAI